MFCYYCDYFDEKHMDCTNEWGLENPQSDHEFCSRFKQKSSIDQLLTETYVPVQAVLDSICFDCCDKDACRSTSRCADYLRILDIPAIIIHLDLNSKEDDDANHN